MIRALFLLLATSTALQAETARILSGEHGDFTRLVIQLPTGSEWTLGRYADGYAFAAVSGEQPEYDFSSVWRLIPRKRLSTLEVDSSTGALVLGLGCDCHVFPFEYGNGVVVLDIKEGPPPPGSTFESEFQSPDPAARPSPAGLEASAEYNWLTDQKLRVARRPAELPLPLDTGAVSLEPLRDELLEQLAKGAVDGLVDMELPGKPVKSAEGEPRELPWSHIRIGEQPGVTVTEPGALIASGDEPDGCAPANLLDLANWGDGQLPHDLLAQSRIGLFGEFDAPVEAEILRSARQLLYLGFGVEAGQTLDLLDPETTDGEEAQLYSSMARLVDGDADPQSLFAKMLECNGPAALWAALSYEQLPAGPGVNRDSILQSFQALPPHLRRHLGPDLAEKFLSRDDSDAARMIRDAMERAPDADPASVALIDAKAKLHDGDVEAAQAHAETAVALDGDNAENLMALVETHFRKLEPMSPEIADALLGLRSETDATSLGPDLNRAIVLALALSNQHEAAFTEAETTDVASDLWQVVTARATDDDFLRHAVLPRDEPRPDVQPDVGRAVADRVLALGFSDAALTWLGPVSVEDPPDLRQAAATAQLQSGAAKPALELLANIDTPEAAALRARALLQLGDIPAAREALSTAGDPDAALRAGLWSGDWNGLDPEAPQAWRQAAEQAEPLTPDAGAGPLARGDESIKASLEARDAIKALLDSVPSPATD